MKEFKHLEGLPVVELKNKKKIGSRRVAIPTGVMFMVESTILLTFMICPADMETGEPVFDDKEYKPVASQLRVVLDSEYMECEEAFEKAPKGEKVFEAGKIIINKNLKNI